MTSKNNLNNSGCFGSSDTPEASKQIKKECLRLLARRDHSRKEIQDKLAFKGYKRNDVSAVVDDLAEKNWQDDTRYAESYARVRSQKGFGPVRIAYELKQQGIDADTIDNIVGTASENWITILEQVYAKKYSNEACYDSNEKGKRIRFLLQRGFSNSMINTLFEQQTKKST